MTESGFHCLELQSVLHDGYRRVFTLQGQELLLLQHAGELHLLENTCPHAAYPLHEGQLVDGALRCPMHGYLFELHSGACTYSTEGPCRGLYRYALIGQDGMVGVQLPLQPLQTGPFKPEKGRKLPPVRLAAPVSSMLTSIHPVVLSIGLLLCSNVFMTFAWYAHLKELNNKPWIIAALVSWGIALLEYLFQVPADRIGYKVLSVGQLKIMQEVITLTVFIPFSLMYLKEPLKLDYLWAGLCLLGAVFFMFRDKLN